MKEHPDKTCTDCGAFRCWKQEGNYPDFCLTTGAEPELMEEVLALYEEGGELHQVFVASAEVEREFYGRYTRVEEIMAFAEKIGARKIGIATCAGLIKESQVFARILKKNGFTPHGIICKVGAVKKEDMGIGKEFIPVEGERICNPVMQAKLLNREGTDLNVVVGLCVGHDSMFYRYAEALTTTLITKDRVTGHNPAAALYTAHSYYKKLL